MSEKKRFGDRKDAKLIRDMDAMHICMARLYGNRTDNEAYISETIDLEPVKAWIQAHPDEDMKYTFFHVIIAALSKVLIQRPKMNRFISDSKYYQRNENVISFIVKRQMTDEAKEGMAIVKPTVDDDVFTIHQKVKGQIIPCRAGKKDNTEASMEFLKKIPEWCKKILFKFILWLSKKGLLPASLTEGDANYTSIFVTNLGSIGLKCGYHHLTNYGNCSVFVVIGEKKMAHELQADGTVWSHETLDIGLTVDERIADGYYYSKTVKLFKFLLEHPEELETPFNIPTEFEKK